MIFLCITALRDVVDTDWASQEIGFGVGRIEEKEVRHPITKCGNRFNSHENFDDAK